MVEINNQGPAGSSLLSKRKSENTRVPTHIMMAEMAEDMLIQNKRLRKDIRGISKSVTKVTSNMSVSNMTNDRIHDRLESLVLEQRTTNILLAQLIAINESVLGEQYMAPVASAAEDVRVKAYNRVFNGE